MTAMTYMGSNSFALICGFYTPRKVGLRSCASILQATLFFHGNRLLPCFLPARPPGKEFSLMMSRSCSKEPSDQDSSVFLRFIAFVRYLTSILHICPIFRMMEILQQFDAAGGVCPLPQFGILNPKNV